MRPSSATCISCPRAATCTAPRSSWSRRSRASAASPAALADLRDAYDLVLIDCPPSLGLLTLNALTAADAVIIPLQCEYYALEGLAGLLETIELVRQQLNPELALEGIALTMVDRRNNLSRQVELEVRSHFGAQVFETVIPRNVRLSEAPSHGKPVLLYDAHSRGATSHLQLAEEILGRHQLGSAAPRASAACPPAKEISMSSRPNALGRGIGALLPGAPPASPAPRAAADRGPAPGEIPVDRIDPNPEQPRRRFDETRSPALSDSIRQHGVLQPVVVRRAGDRYELLVGERRWRAARAAGLAAIPAVVADVDDRDRLELALIENVQRRDLNPIELALAFRTLLESGKTQDEIGRRVSLDRSTRREPPAPARAAARAPRRRGGAAPHGRPRARPCSRSRTPSGGATCATASCASSSRCATPRRSRARRVRARPRARAGARASLDPNLQRVIDALRQRLQTRVRIQGDASRGRVEIEYFGGEDLQRIARNPARRCLSPATRMTIAPRRPVLLAEGDRVQRGCSRSTARPASTASCAAR